MKNTMSSIILLLALLSCVSLADKWVYPITPDDPEWNNLTSIEEKIAVQQIPQNIVDNMSTNELLDAWMELPGRIEVLAYNSLQKGIEKNRQRFNVLDELLKRKDVGEKVLQYYSNLNLSNLLAMTDSLQAGRFITDVAFIELLLAQEDVLLAMNSTDRRRAITVLKARLRQKEGFGKEQKDPFWAETNMIAIGRILDLDDAGFGAFKSNNKDIAAALSEGMLTSKSQFDRLYNYVFK